jgi:hypothetical protein
MSHYDVALGQLRLDDARALAAEASREGKSVTTNMHAVLTCDRTVAAYMYDVPVLV